MKRGSKADGAAQAPAAKKPFWMRFMLAIGFAGAAILIFALLAGLPAGLAEPAEVSADSAVWNGTVATS